MLTHDTNTIVIVGELSRCVSTTCCTGTSLREQLAVPVRHYMTVKKLQDKAVTTRPDETISPTGTSLHDETISPF